MRHAPGEGPGVLGDVVEAGGAELVDAPVVFAELGEAGGGLLCGGEVEVGEFGDGVAEGVVDLALGAVAAVDVGEDFAGEVGGGGGGEGFDAVAGDEDDVGVEFGEGAGKVGGGEA